MLSKLIGAVGVVLLVAGAAFAVRPMSVDERNCGSLFQPDKGITPMQCDTRLNSRGDLVVGLGTGGVALLLTGFGITAVRDRRTRLRA